MCMPGRMPGNVDVWKRLTLESGGADVVTVQAADAEDHVFNVTADWVNISGFAVTGATGSDMVTSLDTLMISHDAVGNIRL